jgi:hypothetical protein
MESGPDAKSLLNDEGWAELVRRIQVGDQAAIRNLYSLFSTSVESLLRRKLGKLNVSAETAEVLHAVIQEAPAISTAQPVNLPRLVLRIIRARFPSQAPKPESVPPDPTGEALASSVIAARTPLEQDILMRYYVLGESLETIQFQLRVTLRFIEDTIAGARADFRLQAQKSRTA